LFIINLGVWMYEKEEQQLKYIIDEACHRIWPRRFSRRIGPSSLGEPCSRKLWYRFRWYAMSEFEPRMLRLFDRGNREEQAIARLLKEAGCEVQLFEDEDKEIQISVEDLQGHLYGFLDGIIKFPENFNLPNMLLEFKTFNSKSFKKLKEGVAYSNPKHWAQMCLYGYKKRLSQSLYIGVNKDDDDMYVRILELDATYGNELLEKGVDIVNSKKPPEKISNSPAYFSCKFCEFSDICHFGKNPLLNCRSCVHSEPREGAKWHCTLHDINIPHKHAHKGCAKWEN